MKKKLTGYCSLLFKARIRKKDINLYTMNKVLGRSKNIIIITSLSLMYFCYHNSMLSGFYHSFNELSLFT